MILWLVGLQWGILCEASDIDSVGRLVVALTCRQQGRIIRN